MTNTNTIVQPRLVAFAGLAGAGKDTAAEYLCAHYGFVRAAFADVLKDMAAQMLDDAGHGYANLYEPGLKERPIAGLHNISARRLMQTMGDWGRELHPDIWVTLLAGRLGMHPSQHNPVHDRIALSDVRFPNEAAWAQAQGGTLVLITRAQAEAVHEHISEQHISALPVDCQLANDGATPLSLWLQLDVLMAEMGLGKAPRAEGGF